MVVILAGERILTAQKGASDAPRDAVISTDIDFINDSASSVSWHGITSEYQSECTCDSMVVKRWPMDFLLIGTTQELPTRCTPTPVTLEYGCLVSVFRSPRTAFGGRKSMDYGMSARRPRQNRVTPFGEIIATLERGAFMGNRGVLHDGEGRIQRAWRERRWIVCTLEFRGRKRAVMTPGRYTELFFLDEATALAAGHRPCVECRRTRFTDFCAAWTLTHSNRRRPTAAEIDQRLHAERIAGDRSKRTFAARLDSLPDGVLVQVDSGSHDAYLYLGGKLLKWSPGGYTQRQSRPPSIDVRVLTPRSTVETIRAGYVPETHASALAAVRA